MNDKSMTLREELEKLQERAGCGDEENYDKEWFLNQIEELFITLGEEVLGEDEGEVAIEPQGSFTQRIAKAKYQNDLRAEQRKRLLDAFSGRAAVRGEGK